MLSTLLDNTLLGLQAATTLDSLMYCFVGVFLGTLIGVLPGIGAMTTISLLLPITFHLTPLQALVMLAGIYYGGAYGGSITSILLNLPGSGSSAVTCLDGYPMARKGRAGVALFMTAMASFGGASIGILIMMLFSPLFVEVGLTFRSPEYFSLVVLGLIAASTVTTGSAIKSVAMVVLGVFLGTVGVDIYSGTSRFTFGITELQGGFAVAAVAMGIFGIGEVISGMRISGSGIVVAQKVGLRSMLPTRDDVRRSWMPMLRGAGIGSFVGALPGTGATMASFLAYAVERRVAKDPSRFGNGAIEGIVAPETANNAADQTAFIPTLTLGIPGSATMALMLVVLLIHGISPGPAMMSNHPDLFWGVVMSFWIGNLMLVVLNIPLINIWVRLLAVPGRVLYPAILVCTSVGVYSLDHSAIDVFTVIGFGILGYLGRVLGFHPAPLLIGFVLGPMAEEYFRRALVTSRGDFMIFVERPISAAFLAVAALMLAWGIRGSLRQRSSRPAVTLASGGPSQG
jgi:TctA family transporter